MAEVEWDNLSHEQRLSIRDQRRAADHGALEGLNRLDVRWTYRTSFTIDVPQLILDNLELYWDVKMEHYGCDEEWMRPEALLWELLTEDVDIHGAQSNRKTMKGGDFDNPEIDLGWKLADFEELIRQYPQLDPERHSAQLQIKGQEMLL